MNNAQLDARLRAANPVAVEYVTPAPRTSTAGRVGQIILAIAVAMSIGAGVAWAASGTNPFASLFSETAKVSGSRVGLQSISTLQPTTQETLDALPPDVAERALLLTVDQTATDERVPGQPTFPDRDATRLDPALISAYSRVRTSLGTPASLLVADNEICTFTGTSDDRLSVCSPIENVENGTAINWRAEVANPGLGYVSGLFDDRVAAIDVGGDSKPPIVIPRNVLELRNVPPGPLTLVGLDKKGEEVFRNNFTLNITR